MSIIAAADIYKRIYREIVVEITRFDGAEEDDTDNEILNTAIDAAIKEAKMYLSRFDLIALFGDGETEPTIDDPLLKNICIDLAIWRLVLLGSPSISFEVNETAYKSAIKSLEAIRSGNAVPEGWTYKDTTGETAAQGDAITWSSNTKRQNHF